MIEDILYCGIRVPLLPCFQKMLEYYRMSLMQLTPNSYRHMAALVVAYKQLGLPPGSSHLFILSKRIQGTMAFIILVNGIPMVSRPSRILKAIWGNGKAIGSRWSPLLAGTLGHQVYSQSLPLHLFI